MGNPCGYLLVVAARYEEAISCQGTVKPRLVKKHRDAASWWFGKPNHPVNPPLNPPY